MSFHAASIMKRILKAVTFHTETTGDHCSRPDEFKLDLEQEEVQSQLWVFFVAFFFFPGYNFEKLILKLKRECCSMF